MPRRIVRLPGYGFYSVLHDSVLHDSVLREESRVGVVDPEIPPHPLLPRLWVVGPELESRVIILGRLLCALGSDDILGHQGGRCVCGGLSTASHFSLQYYHKIIPS